MESDHAGSSLHTRIGQALERAARAQEESILLCEHHEEIMGEVRATLRPTEWRRLQRADLRKRAVG